MWPFRKNRKARRSLPAAVPAVLRARYDAAQTTAENARHWAMADSLSADSAATADVRSKLRERARYEVANNSYAKGIVLTMANDCIGTGPRLQLLSANAEANRRIETAFAQWARAIDLAGKLRTMRMAKSTDGEAFAVLTANPMIDSPVMLDVQLVEADRVASPVMSMFSTVSDIDGIILDACGNPRTYSILRQHPSDLSYWLNAVDMVDADAVVHWFRADCKGRSKTVARGGRGNSVALWDKNSRSFRVEQPIPSRTAGAVRSGWQGRSETKGVRPECIRTWKSGRTFDVRCWWTGSPSGRRAASSAFTGTRSRGF